MRDWLAHNAAAWDHAVETGVEWTMPVSRDAIARARKGELHLRLTPVRELPRAWLPESLEGVRVLCLAGSGGQQAPLLAAAGAHVDVLDLSPLQLARDREVAERESLRIALHEGDMRDLSRFEDACFELVVHPCANLFVPSPVPVWRECARVLRPGGTLLAGFVQPHTFLFDDEALSRGELVVSHRLPYSDLEQLAPDALAAQCARRDPLVFGHTLEDQLGAQCDAGLAIVGLYEDRWPDEPVDDRIATFAATRARKS